MNTTSGVPTAWRRSIRQLTARQNRPDFESMPGKPTKGSSPGKGRVVVTKRPWNSPATSQATKSRRRKPYVRSSLAEPASETPKVVPKGGTRRLAVGLTPVDPEPKKSRFSSPLASTSGVTAPLAGEEAGAEVAPIAEQMEAEGDIPPPQFLSEDIWVLEPKSDGSDVETVQSESSKGSEVHTPGSKRSRPAPLRIKAMVQSASEMRTDTPKTFSDALSIYFGSAQDSREEQERELHEEMDKLGVARPASGQFDDWSDVESVTSRRSMLPSTLKWTGIPMDQATVRANELLQTGKEALEKAGNMRRESKLEAHESLQSLYELTLSLADSRSRHKVSLEQEKTRAAKELVRVERAHARQMAEMRETLTDRLSESQTTLDKTHKVSEAVLSWLNFELNEPIKVINNLQSHFQSLQETIGAREVVQSGGETTTKKDAEILSTWMGVMRAEMNNILDSLNHLIQQKETRTSPRRVPTAPSSPTSPRSVMDQTVHLEPVMAELKALRDDMAELKAREIPLPIITGAEENIAALQNSSLVAANFGTQALDSIQTLRGEVKEAFEGIVEAVGPIRTAVESLRQDVRESVVESSRPIASVAVPMRDQVPMRRATYADALAKPRRAVVVESNDPRKSSEDIITDIKEGVDVVGMGIAVSGLRKGRNCRVVLTVDSDEDKTKMSSAIKGLNRGYTVTEPTPRLPLLKLLGVTNDIPNEKLVEAIRRQNRGALGEAEGESIRVLRRTKHRNGLLTNVVIEVSPRVWQTLRDQRVKLGYQVVLAVDQSPIRQCYKCLGFGHEARNCDQQQSCGYCAEGHDTRTCPRRTEPRCINCKEGPNGAHPAYSTQCPEWRKFDRLARSVVSYC